MNHHLVLSDSAPSAKRKPQVSIGMPVYNGERFIRQSIDSLLAQTYTNFELIISDNFSLDKTEEICREYQKKDKRVIYFRQEKNIFGDNFLFVANKANNDLFMWMADDDLWPPNALDSLVSGIINGEVDLIYGVHQQIDSLNNEVNSSANVKLVFKSECCINFTKHLTFYHFLGTVNALYGLWRRKALAIEFWNNLLDFEKRKSANCIFSRVGSDHYAISVFLSTHKLEGIGGLKNYRREWSREENYISTAVDKKTIFIYRAFSGYINLFLGHLALCVSLWKGSRLRDKVIILFTLIPSLIIGFFRLTKLKAIQVCG